MAEPFQEPEFWDSRYRAGEARWEMPCVPARLERWIACHRGGGAVLIPGCGSGKEISAFAGAGWKVTAIDFAPSAVGRARVHCAGNDAIVIMGDFFTHPFRAGEFDVIYERTFLTALAPACWRACVARYHELLKPGGRVVGYCYYGKDVDPPPFFQPPGNPVLAEAFDLEEDCVSEDALAFFGDRERWQEWRGE